MAWKAIYKIKCLGVNCDLLTLNKPFFSKENKELSWMDKNLKGGLSDNLESDQEY